MNRRQWLERASIALVAGLTACSKEPSPPGQLGPNSTVSVNVKKAGPIIFQTPTAEFHILASGYIQAFLRTPKHSTTLDDPAFGLSGTAGYLVTDNKRISNFRLDFGRSKLSAADGRLGPLGRRITVPTIRVQGLEKTLTVEVYDNFPNLAVVTETYRNVSDKDIPIERVVTSRHRLNASMADPRVLPYQVWSFQGSSYRWGENIIEKISPGFHQPNPMGAATPNGMGGGIPVVAFWTGKIGMGMGHLELLPQVLSLPVRVGSDGRINVSMQLEPQLTLKPGQTYSLPASFVSVYAGDFYKPLHMYSDALQHEGWDVPASGQQAYNALWYSRGYERNVTPVEMVRTIPKLKELDIKWARLDYRWFNAFGDWDPRRDTFPGDSIKRVADDFHRHGLYIQLWWQPLAVDDGQGNHPGWHHAPVVSRLVREHPEWLILDKNGKHARLFNPVRDVAALCPALPEVQRYFTRLTQRFVREWGYDGSKLDSVFSVPLCYNPAHHHKSPQDSVKAMPRVIQAIFETTRTLKPYSVTQICPSGAAPNFAWLPYMNQAVAADPVGSVQLRRRIKMYKALLGPSAAVYGDHVELSTVRPPKREGEIDTGEDFASTVGAGGVIGTKFVWPDPGPHFNHVFLTPARERIWKKWTTIYNREMLSSGTFLDLYNYGYDNPEAYAVQKDGKMFYAFYASTPSGSWRGQIELRGLAAGSYRVHDYENGKEVGTVSGPNPRLKTKFKGHLLLEVSKA